MKGAVTKRVGKTVWQKGFQDHVVRSEADLQDTWTYMDNNPAQWALDSLYVP